MRTIHEFKVTTQTITNNKGDQIVIFCFTALCTDGTLWTRFEQSDGESSDWVKHPDIPREPR